MKYEASDILKSLAIRNSNLGSRWGIGTASQYLDSIASCFSGGGGSPDLGLPCSPERLQKELAEATSRLTYCDDAMGDVDFLTKSVREGTDITKGAVLEYDCVLTSANKDRDGDIVEPKGMVVDANMPALWMHLQAQPIGKFVKLLNHDELNIKGRYALADTVLGRDAATLVKFGALRVSIGFRPSVFEPVEIVKGSDGNEHVRGWRIKQGTIMEKSLVSVPANADSVITAFSQGKLCDPVVKSWAKGHFDSRPVQGVGTSFGNGIATAGGLIVPVTIDLQIKSGGQVVNMPVTETPATETPATEIKAIDSIPPQDATKTGGTSAGMGANDSVKPDPKNPHAGMKCDDCGGALETTGTCQDCGKVAGKSAGELEVKSETDKPAEVSEVSEVKEVATQPETLDLLARKFAALAFVSSPQDTAAAHKHIEKAMAALSCPDALLFN